jgi:uncharacterized membrane protein (UPF0127 family)
MPRPTLFRVRDAATGEAVADRVHLADTHWTRFRGLMGTSGLDPRDGLWIVPCNQVHMFWMRYAIDVVFLDDDRRVVGLAADLRPWRISPKFRAAASVVELAAGTIARRRLAVGDRLAFEAAA